jgi:hypothetical protein
MNLGTLCYVAGFIIALLALFGKFFGLDLNTVVLILALICLAPLVSGISVPAK